MDTNPTLAASLVTLALAGILGCGPPPPEEDVELVVERTPSAHHGESHSIVLVGGPTAPEHRIEQSCDGGEFVDVGAVNGESPVLVTQAPTTVTVDDPIDDWLLLDEELLAIDAQIDALPSVAECRADPSCAADLEALEVEGDRLRAERSAALERTSADPRDLDGDEAIDLESVATTWARDGRLSIRIRPFGAWPPSDDLYSWYAIVRIYASSADPSIAQLTIQRHSGTRETFFDGVLADDVEIVETSAGLDVLVRLTGDATHVSLESGVQPTPTGARVTDVLPDDGRLGISLLEPAIAIDVAECVYRGVPLDGGPAIAAQEAPPRGRPRYADWDMRVEITGDPCEGRTPFECYHARLDHYRRRVCGEVNADGSAVATPPPVENLPQPYSDICRNLRAGWVAFRDPVCEQLSANGAPANGSCTPAPATAPRPVGGNAMGRTSIVAFDAQTFASDVCSYATFIHEMMHVLDNGQSGRAGEVDVAIARSELATRLFDEADARLQAVRASGDQAEIEAAEATRDAARSAATRELRNLVRIRLEQRFDTECTAFETVLGRGEELVGEGPARTGADAGALRDERLEWAKAEVWIFLSEMDDVLDAHTYPTLGNFSDAGRARACACIDRYRERAQQPFLPSPPVRPVALWTCAAAERPYQALRTRLMCPPPAGD